MDEQVLEKWKDLISACKAYYIDSLPTGMNDAQYDALEAQAASEGFYVRDYVLTKYLVGTKYKNSYIEKIKKTKVSGTTMLEAILETEKSLGEPIYCDLKYDGSSLAIYLDPTTGIPKRVVTVGNQNLDDFGVDQTWKLLGFLPKQFPLGIVAIQAEALIDISRLPEGVDPERARQKANGLINSKYCEDEIANYLTIRAYRYYTDNSPEGIAIYNTDYREVLSHFGTTVSPIDGHIMFAPAEVYTTQELQVNPGHCEADRTQTRTGLFLNDGWVIYNSIGICKGALKFSGAGSGDAAIVTKVTGIKWNDQTSKGKDSWSANVLVEPVTIKGSVCTKPSAGSVGNLLKKGITPGATVSIYLANSTIPAVGDCYEPGNGDYQWPVCSCGYHLGPTDIYGSNLKCGNPECSQRVSRMKNYLFGLSNILDLDLNKYLVIDRFKWENTSILLTDLLSSVERNDEQFYYNYLRSFLTTDLQKRNLDLVWKASFNTLREIYEIAKRN